ncbi:type III secretion system translocon subunit SctE [Sodalis sp. C49]|uniref:type III secretion system translocon subunit SctE n=1 Tax=Sodalis sp. C49 TaxID=3228929 RepID=UPI003965B2F9
MTQFHGILNGLSAMPNVNNRLDAIENTGAQDNNINTPLSREQTLTLNAQSRQATEALLATISASSDLQANMPAAQATAADLPLAAPSGNVQTSNNNRISLQEIFNTVKELLVDVSLGKLADRLTLLLSQKAAFDLFNSALSAEYQQAIEASQIALDTAEADRIALQNAENELAEKQRALDRANVALSQLSPEDEGFATAQQSVREAQDELNQASAQRDLAQSKMASSYQAARESITKLDDIYNQGKNANALPLDATEVDSAINRLLALMNTFNKLVQKNRQRALEEDSALFRRMQESLHVEMKHKAAKAAEDMRKSEALNKTMGCVGKILGALITAISVVAAVFTGGASLALAAVGLALIAADAIGKAITGVSFLEQAMRPLMEGIIQPLISMLSKAITNLLAKLGVDANTAAMVGAIVGALVAAALIVAVMVLGKSAGGKIASSALGKMIAEAIKKLVPDVLKNLGRQTSAAITDSFKRLMDKLSLKTDRLSKATFANRLEKLNNTVTYGSSMFQSVGSIRQGVIQKRLAETLAAYGLLLAEDKQWKKMLLEAIDYFKGDMELVQQQFREMSSRQAQTYSNTLSLFSNNSLSA